MYVFVFYVSYVETTYLTSLTALWSSYCLARYWLARYC